MTYHENLTILEARKKYFELSGFDDKTYNDKWVRLPFLGRTFYMPNFKARKKVIPLHDIDHILTEYKTDWFGEWQISVYEIGTGCGKYGAAWFINSQGIIPGAIFNPGQSVRAFARGRQSKGVYHYDSHEPLMSQKVGELRKITTVPADSIKPTWQDAILFYLIVLGAIVFHFGPLVLIAYFLFF